MEGQTEELILQEQLAEREANSLTQRAAVLRVYNYYRIVLSFSLMILFYEVPDQTFVGSFEPEFFQTVILAYVILNVASEVKVWRLHRCGVYTRIPRMLLYPSTSEAKELSRNLSSGLTFGTL